MQFSTSWKQPFFKSWLEEFHSNLFYNLQLDSLCPASHSFKKALKDSLSPLDAFQEAVKVIFPLISTVVILFDLL